MDAFLTFAGGVVAWLLSGVTLWLIVLALCGCTLSVLSKSAPKAEWAALWLGILSAIALYANPEWFWWMVGNPLWVGGGIVAYLFTGFVVSMTKWYMKASVVKTAMKIARREFIGDLNAGRLANSKSGWHGVGQNCPTIAQPTTDYTETTPIKREWAETFNYYIKTHRKVKNAVNEQSIRLTSTEAGGIGPDLDAAPIKTWWFFWPFAVFSVVYIPLANFVTAWFERTRGLYKRISSIGSTDSMYESK